MSITDAVFETVNNFGQTVGDILTQLAEVVGKTAVHLYTVLVRQQIVYGVQNLVYFLLYFGFAIFAGLMYKKFNKTSLHSEDKLMIYALLLVLAVYSVTQAIPYLNTAIAYFINPEYYAILEAKTILQSIK